MGIGDELEQAEFLEQLARRLGRLEGGFATIERTRLEEMLGDPGRGRAGAVGLPMMSFGSADTERSVGATEAPLIEGRLYNGDFATPPPDRAADLDMPVGTVGPPASLIGPNQMSAWTFAVGVGMTAVTARWIADVTQGSGGILRFSMAAGIVNDVSVIFQKVPINASSARSTIWRAEAGLRSSSIGLGEAGVSLAWLEADGVTQIGSTNTNFRTMDQIAALGGETTISAGHTLAPPANAAYAYILAFLRRGSAATSYTCAVDILEINLVPSPTFLVLPDSIDPTLLSGGAQQQNGIVFLTAGGDTGPRLSLDSVTGDVGLAPTGTGDFNLRDFGMSIGGTAFPGSPTADDVFYRTDLDGWFFFDGTQWLSTTQYHMPVPFVGITTTIPLTVTTTGRWAVTHPFAQMLRNVYIEDVVASGFVASGGTALSVSHKWTATLVSQPTGTTYATLNFDDGASNTYKFDDVAADVVWSNGQVGVTVTWTKTGTPGDLTPLPLIIHYRIIAT